LPRILRDLTARFVSAALPRVAWDKRYYRQWEKAGYHVTPNHFFFPIPNSEALTDGLWEKESELVGVNMNPTAQLRLLKEVFPKYADEAVYPKKQNGNAAEFYLENGSFGPIDAEVLHCMIRHFKPKKIVEIGAGYSTLVSARACMLNKEKDGAETRLVAIEPYPNETLKQGFPGLTQLIEKPLEQVPLSMFTGLSENDFVFIDSTHVLKIGGDVKYLYLEVLPRLAGGVLVHSHDIFFPAEYPKQWVRENHWFWTEQYLLQAFLAFNCEFEVVWASQYMTRRYPKEAAATFTSFGAGVSPGSLWIKRKTAEDHSELS
jgi:predicted O-methyltransferase YrrM